MTQKDQVALIVVLLTGWMLLAGFVRHRTRRSAAPLSFTRIEAGRIVDDEGQSRGLAWGDYDNDGDVDLYVANTGGQWNFFYRNNGDGSFAKRRGVEVVRHGGFSEGVNWIDYDNDGDLDLFVVNTATWEEPPEPQPNFLFRNDADSGFVRIIDGPLVSDATPSSAACWADYDHDGNLDVFVVNRNDQDDVLYFNDGRGNFTHATEGPWIGNGGEARTCAAGDAEGDNDTDLYVGNFRDQNNFFYRNDGRRRFTQVTDGAFVNSGGSTYGASWVDYDGDGHQDLLVTNIGRNDRNELYRNDGSGHFMPVTGNPIVDHVKYGEPEGRGSGASKGHTWGDYDNDGDLDLYIANGTYAPDMRNFLYRNAGNGQFVRITEGAVVVDADTSAGTAWGDYDNDGDLDLFVANWGSDDENNALYRNDTGDNHWISIRLDGRPSNRSGIGARVRLKATIQGTAAWQTRWIAASTGYASQNALAAHFGLGDATRVDSLEIRWPSGVIDVHTDVTADRFWVGIEGETLRLDERRSAAKKREAH